MEERRRHIRIQTPILVEFRHPETQKPERSFTQDVGESGMRFPTTAKLQVGQELPLSLQFPESNAILQATGRVVWVRQIAAQGPTQYEVGVTFLWVEDPDRRSLLRHLASFFRRWP